MFYELYLKVVSKFPFSDNVRMLYVRSTEGPIQLRLTSPDVVLCDASTTNNGERNEISPRRETNRKRCCVSVTVGLLSPHTHNWLFTLITLFHKAHAEFTTGSDAQMSNGPDFIETLLQDGFMFVSQ